MVITKELLGQLIDEELQAALVQRRINELFGRDDFMSVIGDVMKALQDANKKVERAHELAPTGPAKAIIAGIHSEIFNQIAELRPHIDQLRALAK